MEVVGAHVASVHRPEHRFESGGIVERHQLQEVVVVVEDDDGLIKDVEHVGCVVFALRLVFDVDALEVAHAVERRVAEDAEVVCVVAFDVQMVGEVVDGLVGSVVAAHLASLLTAVGIAYHRLAVSDGHRCDGA